MIRGATARTHVSTAGAVTRPQSVTRLRGPFWAVMVFTFILFIGPQFIFPPLQVIRPALLSAGAAVGLYLFERFAHGGTVIAMAPPVRSLLVLVLLAAMSIPTSLWPGGSFDLFTEFLKSVLIGLLLGNVLTSTHRMKVMVASLVGFGLVMAFTAVRDYSSGNLRASGVRIGGYDSPLAGNPNDLALTLNLIVGLAIGLYYAMRHRLLRRLLLGGIMLMVGAIVVTFSRAGFVTLMATALVFLWQRARRRDVATVAATMALAVLFVIFSPAGYGDRIYSIFDFKADDGSAQARWDGMALGIELIKERPLFGFGLGANGLEFAERGYGWTGLHNAVLLIGAEAGVAAMVVYLFIIWQLFRQLGRLRKRLRHTKAAELDALAMGTQLALVGFAVSTMFYPVTYHFYLFYIIGFAVALQTLGAKLSPTSVDATKARRRPAAGRGR